MTIVVSKKLAKKDIKDILGKMTKKSKVFDAKKYFGKASIQSDPLKIQQEMRDE